MSRHASRRYIAPLDEASVGAARARQVAKGLRPPPRHRAPAPTQPLTGGRFVLEVGAPTGATLAQILTGLGPGEVIR